MPEAQHHVFFGGVDFHSETEPGPHSALSVTSELSLLCLKLQSVCKDISYLVDPLNKVLSVHRHLAH